MKLYHGTRHSLLETRRHLAEFPEARSAANGVGFFLTDCRDIALSYGHLIEYEVDSSWVCNLMRPIQIGALSGIEYVLSQREADALVVDHALSIKVH